MRIPWIVCLIFLNLSLSARANETCERRLLEPVPIDLALRFLSETLQTDLKTMGDLWARDNAIFRQWLDKNKVVWTELPDGTKYETLGRFLAPQLEPYKESHLQKRRAAQLAGELVHRGARRQPGEPGYQLLKRLSLENFRTLLAQFQSRMKSVNSIDSPPATLQQIEDAVKKLAIGFVHNTTQLERRPTFPLLSARELSDLGITGKLNTQSFNSEILKTHGNIFFFAIPYSKASRLPVKPSQYGSRSIVLNEFFAQEWGWMSPFIMYPNELLDLAHRLLKIQPHSGFVKEEDWRPMIQELHRFDMRPSEYVLLLQETLKLTMVQLSLTDPKEFQRILKALETGKNLDLIVNQYCLEPLGLSSKQTPRALELKVPVAVPPNVLDVMFDPKSDYPSTSFEGPHLTPKGPLLHRPDPLF